MTGVSLDEVLAKAAAEDTPCPTKKACGDCVKDKVSTLKGNESLINTLSNTPIQALYDNDRTQNRLRWLAFYYLSKRELSRYELQQKLKNKDFELCVIEPLLDEFAKEGYQSDLRFAQMLVRESIRKNRGTRHIAHSLKKAQVQMDMSVDELIASVTQDTLDDTILQNDNADEGVDWLLLAVEARCKKYGDTVPKDPKEKARQLRFLQYRGFTMDVCFEALKHSLSELKNARF